MVKNRPLLPILACGFFVLFALSACKKDIYTLDQLSGKSESVVILELGRPEIQREIKLNGNTRLHEYQFNLYKVFPDSDKKEVAIKEYQWKKDSDTVVVWFAEREGAWTVVDTLGWSKTVKF